MHLPPPYYQDNACVIYHGDCRELVPLFSGIDVVITDPPYGVALKGKKTLRQRRQRTLRHGRTQVFRPGQYTHEDTPEYVTTVVVPVIALCRTLAPAVVLTPGKRNLWAYPPADDVGCFYYGAGAGRSAWGFSCMTPILYYGKDPYLSAGLGSRPNSQGQSYPNDANVYDHPCVKPIRQWKWLVMKASLAGQLILDPFMGSGTTLVAAKDLGRRAIGIEIEERYCALAVHRLRQEVLPFPQEPHPCNSPPSIDATLPWTASTGVSSLSPSGRTSGACGPAPALRGAMQMPPGTDY